MQQNSKTKPQNSKLLLPPAKGLTVKEGTTSPDISQPTMLARSNSYQIIKKLGKLGGRGRLETDEILRSSWCLVHDAGCFWGGSSLCFWELSKLTPSLLTCSWLHNGEEAGSCAIKFHLRYNRSNSHNRRSACNIENVGFELLLRHEAITRKRRTKKIPK